MSDITQLQGDIVAGFKMLRLLGRGGNGAVYLARQLSVDKIAACKILFPHLVSDPVYIKNFVHEARLAARLEHPNIIQALDVGCDGNLSYFIMEYVPGKSLEKIRTSEPERITLPFLLDISISLAGALDHAWKKFHIFHGDIKPDNLLIRDGDDVLKLADLGLAKIVGKDDLATDIMATPLYASPEVILADGANIGIKSDIYSFGIMLYELLSGKAPFRGNMESVLRQHVDTEPLPLEKARPDLDRELAGFINRMISKTPADRPHDWDEIKYVLQQIRARTPDSKKNPRSTEKKQFFSLIISIIFLILAAGIAFAIFKLF